VIETYVLNSVRAYKELGTFDNVLLKYSHQWSSIPPFLQKYHRAQQAVELIDNNKVENFRALNLLSIWVEKVFEEQTVEDMDRNIGYLIAKTLSDHDLV